MAVEKTALRITELDFLSIKENLKDFLRSQSEFTDYDFEGSGMSVLLDILAYNTHYMGYYLNMVGNEMFLDTAQLRNSILSHAKLMNYVPGSKQGSTSKINIVVTPTEDEDQDTNVLTLEKYTQLIGSDIDGINYPFVTLYSNTAYKDVLTGSFTFANVNIKQGEVVTQQYLVDSSNQKRRFEIPSANVDTKTIAVAIQESYSNTSTESYILAHDVTELTGNSKVYFLEENENLNYSLYFGDNYIGKKPKDGNIILVTYLDNVGTSSNNISKFIFSDAINGKFANRISITSISPSFSGVDKETVEEIRFRAPYFYSTQNRAVTKNDYETLLLKDYDYLDSVAIWGGEENEPVVYGKVFLSLKTKGNYVLTNFEKEKIKKDLIKYRNVLTVTPEIIDPDYTYLMIKGKIYYDPLLTSASASDILQLVKASISDYNNDELNKFNSIFRKSKLQSYVENAEKSITGSDLKIYIQKRFLIDTENARSYTVNFRMAVQPTEIDKFYSFPEIQIYDADFKLRSAFIDEVPDVKTGIQKINVTSGGRNYTTTPTVVITGDGSGAKAYAKILSGRVTNVIITDPGENYTYAAISLIGGDGVGAAAEDIQFQNKYRQLRSFYYDEITGKKIIINNNIGSVYYPTGVYTIDTIKIFNVTENPYYETNYLTFVAPSLDENIYPKQNRILTIDENDLRSIVIDVVTE